MRAVAILDPIFKAIEALGGSVNSDLSVKIRGDVVRFRMSENQKQVPHKITKQEAEALAKYHNDIKKINGFPNRKSENMTRYMMVLFE